MNGSADDSTFRALHRLVEHYTPDGTLGRVLLGGAALFLAPFLFFGGTGMLTGAASFVAFVTGLLGAILGVPALLLGIVVLWPVYLSLIGNVDSPAAYPEGTSTPEERGTSPETVLKRRYADGELSREEFERRLDDVMGTAPASDDGSGVGDRESGTDDRVVQRERSGR